jgi:hypothetical protein
MKTIEALCVSSILAASIAPAIAAPDSTAPSFATAPAIRHLRYTVTVGTRSRQDVTNYYGNSSTGNAEMAANGSIVADVIGIAKDNALIFRLSETTDSRKAPAVQVGVLGDGSLSYDPKSQGDLLEEEMTLAGLLGRAVVADHTLEAGQHWDVTYKQASYSSTTTYKVDGLQGDNEVDLDVQRLVKVTGPQPFDALTTGKVRYDYKLSVPIAAHLQQHMHYADVDSSQSTADLSFDYKLSEDSMAAAKP